jgi:hypothetical protein
LNNMLDQTPQNNSQSIKGTDFSSQFNLAPVPMHTHNGIDSSKINYSPANHTHDGVNSKKISYLSLTDTPTTSPIFITAVNTNGTNSVSVSSIVPLNCTITGVFSYALDSTAGVMGVYNNGSVVVTFAKGSASGVMAAGGQLYNTNHVANTPMTVTSSTSGNSTIFITYHT